MKTKALIPVEQDLVPFHDHKIFGVRLLDERIAASMRSLCKMLKISLRGQIQRILRDEVLSKHLLLVIVETPGGPQAIQVLTAQAIPTWITGIQSSMVAPEKRPLILALKEEAVEVLYRHFFHIEAEPTPPPQRERPDTSSDSPAQMIAEVAQTMGEAAHLIIGAVQTMGKIAQRIEAREHATDERLTTLATEYAAMQETQQTLSERLITLEGQHEVLKERQQAMGEHLVEISERQEVAEERWEVIGDYVVETRERVTALEQRRRGAPATSAGDAPQPDGPILSPQHLAQVFVLAREARRQRGTPVSEQLAALAGAFGVPDVSDLPDAAWDEVLAWFWERRGR